MTNESQPAAAARARPPADPETSANARLEAFCDAVFAFALTLLIVDVRLPDMAGIGSTAELWRGLGHLGPSFFAFLLSFAIVLITWVNHHNVIKLVHRTSAPFIYANGFLLLTVVFIPFPTSLLGAFVLTDHAAPAVVLYDAVIAVQALAWLSLSGTALHGRLLRSDRATATMREHRNQGVMAFALYGLLALAAFWWPLTVAAITTATWLFWLTVSIRTKIGAAVVA